MKLRLLIKGEFQFHTTWLSFSVVATFSIGRNNTVVCDLITLHYLHFEVTQFHFQTLDDKVFAFSEEN